MYAISMIQYTTLRNSRFFGNIRFAFSYFNSKIGASIVLLRNINSPKLYNGKRLYLNTLKNNIIETTILIRWEKGEDVYIPRILIKPSD